MLDGRVYLEILIAYIITTPIMDELRVWPVCLGKKAREEHALLKTQIHPPYLLCHLNTLMAVPPRRSVKTPPPDSCSRACKISSYLSPYYNSRSSASPQFAADRVQEHDTSDVLEVPRRLSTLLGNVDTLTQLSTGCVGAIQTQSAGSLASAEFDD